MSASIRIACLKCKVALWVGQSSLEFDVDLSKHPANQLTSRWDSYLYTGERKTMAGFKHFMNDHVMRCHKVIIFSDGDGNPWEKEKTWDFAEYTPPNKKRKRCQKHNRD